MKFVIAKGTIMKNCEMTDHFMLGAAQERVLNLADDMSVGHIHGGDHNGKRAPRPIFHSKGIGAGRLC
jgi:hypothetical protein